MLTSEVGSNSPVSLDFLQDFARQSKARRKAKTLNNFKKSIWLYIILLIVEGALRKWIIPSLATPLLIVRDPVAIYIMVYGYLNGMFKSNIYVSGIWIISLISVFTTLLLGHGNLGIAIYGLRILVLHFPLIFIIGTTFNKEDVVKVGKFFLWTTIFMTVLIAIQFYSPQTAWVNVGVGGIGSSGFTATKDFFRPSGVFSFTNGVANYYGLAGAFICFFLVDNTKGIPKWLLTAATFGLIAAIPLSISRSVFFQFLLTGAFTILIASQKPKLVGRMVGAIIGLAIVLMILNTTTFFQTGTSAFTDRFESAGKVEGGTQNALVDRIFGGLLSAIQGGNDLPFFGYGLGLGTNAGAAILTGKASFLFSSEGEWSRIIGEMGIILGLGFIIIRVGTAVSFTLKSFKDLKKGNYLPWLLSSFGFLAVFQGQWGQTTSLGFAIVTAGLTFAALLKPHAPTI